MAKNDDNVTDLPQVVDFDLDAETREEQPPFRTKVQDRVISLIDPETIDWRDLVDVGDNPVNLLTYALDDDDRVYLYGLELKGWQLERLVKAYLKHFKFEDKLKQARRERAAQGL